MASRIKLLVLDTPEAVAQHVAGQFVSLVRDRPGAVLGLATGSTPERSYAEIVRLSKAERVSFAGVHAFNLDEYHGIACEHPQSYRTYMNRHLFDHLDVRPWNTYVLNGAAADVDAECASFEAKIKACGGIDLWLLGIGTNGHVAFNEPGSPADSRTRKVALAESTLASNADGRFFKTPAEVPPHALTAGVGTVLDARRLLLVAIGAKKAEIVAKAVKGPKTPDVPASLLQDHADCTFVLDKAAAERI
ncbi:MAG: glucosamine-6-phosphate deaminase [Planctomycetota bacterium]|nr:glucosamine-6-phosphate deaminase [Planctomycetota bacterium]